MFQNNYFKVNSERSSQVMLTTGNKLKFNVGGSLTCDETTVKLLGITVDNKLSFEPHLNTVCKKVNHKLHALPRISNYISQYKHRITMKTFVTWQLLPVGMDVPQQKIK